MLLTNLTYRPYQLISAPKIHTDLLWDLSILFIGISVVYFVSIFLFKKRFTRLAKRTQKIKVQISPMISEFIFLEDDATKDEKSSYVNLKVEIRELIKDKFYRKTVTEILLDLRKDVSGVARKRLFELYKDLGLHKESYKKLRSWRWEAISQGIRELTQMQVAESYGFVAKFINDKRPTIRKQAEIAVVTLKHEGINYFLDTTKHRISEWQQLKLLEVLGGQKDFLPPNFKIWLTSKNKYVVLFALRLIKHYDQNDASASIIELVKHKNKRIKREAIDCIKIFHITDALETLKAVFWKCSVDTKILILDAIGNLGTEGELDFLRLIDNKEASFAVRSKALAAINMISPETILPTEGILDTSEVEIPKDIKEKKKEVLEDYNSLDEYVDEPLVETTVEDSIAESPATETVHSAQEETETAIPISPNVTNEESQEEQIDPDTKLFTAIESMKTEDRQKDLFENKPNEETTDAIQEPLEKERGTTSKFSLDFLPLIVQETGTYTAEKTNQEVPEDSETMKCNQIIVRDAEIVSSHPSAEEAETTDSTIRFDLTEADMHFIPFVTENIPDKEADEYTNETFEDVPEEADFDHRTVTFEFVASVGEIQPQSDPLDLEVVYEELQPNNNDTDDFISEFEMEVVYEEVLAASNAKEVQEASPSVGSNEKDLMHLEVIFENLSSKVAVDKAVTSQQIAEEAYELTVIYEEIKSIDLGVFQKPDLEHGTDPEAIEVFYEEIEEQAGPTKDGVEEAIDEQQLPDWLLEEIASPTMADRHENEVAISDAEWNAKTPKMVRDLNYFLQYLPESAANENELSGTMHLLDNIEFFGDERELPLLEELMQKEKREDTLSRIQDIMARFQGNQTKVVDTVNPESKTDESKNDAPYSIFEEFFRHCDTESKLILLGEIVAVGDEKEVYFLEKLLEDPEPLIQKKASDALALLKERLGNGSESIQHQKKQPPISMKTDTGRDKKYEQLLDEMELAPPMDSDIFDIGFELLDGHQNMDGTEPGNREEEPPEGSRFIPFKNRKKRKPGNDG